MIPRAKSQAAAEVVPSVPEPTAPLPQAPVAATAGPDGYPQLPAVSAMLGSATQTLQSINEQARVLEARVVQTQMENEAKMARQKAVFEQKLKSQEDRSRAVVAANQRLSSEIAAIRANITALQTQAHDVQAANEIMRSEMNTLEGKLTRGREFLLSSLKNLDDTKAPQLAVLQEFNSRHGSHPQHLGKVLRGTAADVRPNKKKHVREVMLQIPSNDTNDNDPDEVSFLALGTAHVQRASQPAAGANAAGSPKDVLNMLGQAVTTLQQQEHLSEAKLKVMFLTNFKAGVKRYAALLAEQRKMITTRKTLLAQQAELRVADEHLQVTHSALQQQLRSFGLFTQKLAHLALAPTQEATELLRHLPANVKSGMQQPLTHA
eukprot:CAMPEP_0172715994 /NCGR_PEP_ID=MMETSP1074-20121228/67861_1 /TAXON_ID=2916 /ORGANISM="Ceratium fusus, Strain PA161109" /LENGTH=376 /DNA_ID=CAMNT_0013540631 /DNA_START=215 /DNA_END=1345 /DNA_ORIENTATION=-